MRKKKEIMKKTQQSKSFTTKENERNAIFERNLNHSNIAWSQKARCLY